MKKLSVITFSVLLLIAIGIPDVFAFHPPVTIMVNEVRVHLSPQTPQPINFNSPATILWSLDGNTYTGCEVLADPFSINLFGGGGPTDTFTQCFQGVYSSSGTVFFNVFIWNGQTYVPLGQLPQFEIVSSSSTSLTCGPKTSPNAQNQCVPNLSQICGQGTIISGMMCVAQSMGSVIGGTLLEINTVSLLVGAIGVNPVITTLIGITVAGILTQAAWFVYRRRKLKIFNSYNLD